MKCIRCEVLGKDNEAVREVLVGDVVSHLCSSCCEEFLVEELIKEYGLVFESLAKEQDE